VPRAWFRVTRPSPRRSLRRGGADPGHQLHHPEAGDAVARILDEAQQSQHFLDVGRIQEFEPAKLHKGDVASGAFHFERSAMVRGEKQDRLLFQHGAAFAVLQYTLDDVASLAGLVANADELRPLGGGAIGPEVFGEALAREIDDAVGGGENRLRRAIVSVKRDDLSWRAELSGKVEDIAHRRGAKRIDHLRVVADHGEAAPAGF
jgi:hypothetical protein